MRHIISILLQNEAGALARVANLFSTRGYNIESLNVAPTNNELVSRLTLVTAGSDDVMDQISKQLAKLVDVVNIVDIGGFRIAFQLGGFFWMDKVPRSPLRQVLFQIWKNLLKKMVMLTCIGPKI